MRRKSDYTWFWNTGQDFTRLLILAYLLLVCTRNSTAYPDFIDSMSRQFFGVPDDANTQQNQQYQQNPNPFSQMFGSHSQPVPARPPPPPQHHNQRRPELSPQRQGYYAPHPGSYQQPYHPQPARPHHSQPTQRHPPYNGPPPVYGQQHGFGQVKTEGNETQTEGFPGDEKRGQHATASYPPPVHRKQHVPTEYHIQDPHQTAIEYHHHPATAIEYQHPPVEYHHIPEHAVEYHPAPQHPPVEEHHGPAIETLSEPHHHEPPEHVEYHHQPEHHHYPEKKPKRFHISFHQSPDYKIVDKHLKLPPVKFRFHINPKIVITSNTKDPLDKKHHHDEEHDLEPYPPPDAFSDHNAPPSYNEHTVEHYPTEHHYPVHHHSPYPVEHHLPVEHHHHDASGYSGGKYHPLEQHPPAYPRPQHAYDLSAGHSHVNPHRSGGHYEPTFKIKTRPIIFTEPPPTPRTTTRRPTTTTARTTTTTTTTTTRRPRGRTLAGLNARNPRFTAAFTQAATTTTTSIERQGEVSDSTTSTSTTRRSIFGNNSERERENGVITARKDESSSITTASVTPSLTTTTTTTTVNPTTSTTTTTMKPTTSTTTTTMKPTTSTTTTTTPKPTTSSTTTTTPVPSTMTTTTQKPTTATKATPSTSRATPAEETTLRTTTTLNVDANEIDMRKDTDTGRRRPEPLKEESLTTIERTQTFNFENSESVKVIETTMLIDGKNQTVKFYYITQPVKLPLDVFQRMTGQKKNGASGINVIKIRD